jgi:hypothetical protein
MTKVQEEKCQYAHNEISYRDTGTYLDSTQHGHSIPEKHQDLQKYYCTENS